MSSLTHNGNIDIELLTEIVSKAEFVKDIERTNQGIIAKTGNCRGIEIRIKKKKIVLNTIFSSKTCRHWFYFSIFVLGLVLPLLIYFFAWYIPCLIYRRKLIKILRDNTKL
jgi:hypothetical protein